MVRATNVLLIGKETKQTLEFRQSLTKVPGYKLTFETGSENAVALLSKGLVDCVIFDYDTLGLVQVALIRSICEVSKVPQILVFANSAEDGIANELRHDKNLIVIEKPLLEIDKDVAGLCVRLINEGAPKFHRESLRHSTSQAASVALASGKSYAGRFINMSDKGACLEINTGLAKINEKIKITIELEKINRRRIIMAEIRWVKSYPGKSIIGVRFSKEDAGL